MNRLLKVEMTRLTWRKVPLLSFVVLLVIVLLALTATHFQARDSRPGSQAYEQAVEWYEADKADYEENGDEYLADCLEMEAQDREETNDPAIDYGCETSGPGSLDDYINTLGQLEPQIGDLLGGAHIHLLVGPVVGRCLCDRRGIFA